MLYLSFFLNAVLASFPIAVIKKKKNNKNTLMKTIYEEKGFNFAHSSKYSASW